MVHGDDKGLILPPIVAPIQIIIIPIYKNVNEHLVKEHANRLKDNLVVLGYRVFVDDRDEFTAGWKYNEWEMKGVPVRINIGQRDIENNNVEIVRRDNRQKSIISVENLSKEIEKIFQSLQSDLYNKAEIYLKEKTRIITSFKDFKGDLDSYSGFIVTGWCGNEDCEVGVKDDTGADIRVIPFDIKDIPTDLDRRYDDIKECIYCGKKAKKTVIFAKAY
jgi:prolyl-tRNA synthetase